MRTGTEQLKEERTGRPRWISHLVGSIATRVLTALQGPPREEQVPPRPEERLFEYTKRELPPGPARTAAELIERINAVPRAGGRQQSGGFRDRYILGRPVAVQETKAQVFVAGPDRAQTPRSVSGSFGHPLSPAAEVAGIQLSRVSQLDHVTGALSDTVEVVLTTREVRYDYAEGDGTTPIYSGTYWDDIFTITAGKGGEFGVPAWYTRMQTLNDQVPRRLTSHEQDARRGEQEIDAHLGGVLDLATGFTEQLEGRDSPPPA